MSDQRTDGMRSAARSGRAPRPSGRHETERDPGEARSLGRDHDPETRADLAVLVVGPSQAGGINRYIEEQLQRLEARVAVTSHDSASPGLGAGRFGFAKGVLLGVYAMLRFFVRTPPDIVHVHSSHRFSFYRASVYVLYSKHVWGIPVVLHIHGSSFDDFVATRSRVVSALQRLVFGRCDDIVVLSEYWREVVEARADPEAIRVLPNAVDLDWFRTGSGGDTAHIVFVSSLIERKGVRELTTAIDQVVRRRRDGVRVTVAGDGPLSGEVETLAARHDEVEYLGYVTEERKRSLLRDGSIFVLPTYAEGLPIAVLEAMAAGNAIVTTSVGSIPEVVGTENGVLLEPGDVTGLVDALNELVDDPERRRSMGEANRRAVEDRYNWDDVVDELVRMYEHHV